MRSRARASVARLLSLGLLAGCAGSSTPPPEVVDAGSEPLATTPAYYSAEQAARGRRVFGSVCSVCHSRNDFQGPIFELTWMAEPVGNLFQHISTTMPQDRPGSLELDEYASVVAYLLQLNGRPAGERELPAVAEQLSHMTW